VKRIVIVGLGFIGGSLAGACQKAFPRAEIVGVSRTAASLQKARRQGWIDKGYPNLAQAFEAKGARPLLVILCTPVDTLRDLLLQLDQVAWPGTVVTDTGSVKGFLVRWAESRTWRRIHFVGAHPMAGSHERGIDHAAPHLFDHALTFITPGRRGPQSTLRLTTNFWKKLSGRVVLVSPEEHDRFAAQVSHLPHLLAALLVVSTPPKALGFAASGFLDATRIAKGEPSLWVPIFLENRKELHPWLENFSEDFERVKRIIRKGDRERLKRILTQAQRRRVDLGKGSCGVED